MLIPVNNQGSIKILEHKGGVIVEHIDSKGQPEQRNFINEADIVMLLNYYYNCKNGLEKSDYIK